LKENAQALGADRRRSPPHQGPALLQGLVLWYAEHVRQLGGESPLDNLMEVKS
jgi:hypothetical protein